MARVLVTGGAGFIGSHCVDCLIERGHTVVVFDKKTPEQADNLKHCLDQVTYIAADLSDFTALKKAMAGCDVVLHLAAFVSVPGSIEDPLTSYRDNVTGTLHVFESMRQLGVMRGVYASSAAVYGDPTVVPTSESCPSAPLSPYGTHKVINEQCAKSYSDCYGLTLTGFRFFNVYGERQDPSSAYSGVISIFVDRVMRDDQIMIYGDGTATRDFVYIGDVAKICAEELFVKESAERIYNVGSGRSTSLLDLVKVMSEVKGCEIEPKYSAPREGDILHSRADLSIFSKSTLPEPQTSLADGIKELMK